MGVRRSAHGQSSRFALRATAHRRRGFTLLEASVALGFLAVTLVAIYNLNYGAMANHAYAKKVTVASLLARSKMIDLEQQLYDEGFSTDDEEEDGDFSEEGWPAFKWRAKIIAPKTQGLPPEQLLGALFNLPTGDGEEGGEGGDPLAGLASMFMGGAGGDPAAGGGAMGGLASMAAPMMQGQMTQIVDQITKSVREVHLTVYWLDGKQVESFDVVTHVVSLGPGSDRNSAVAGSTAPPPPGQTPPQATQTFDAVTGAPCPPGGLRGPSGNPCVSAEQYAASRGGQMPPGYTAPMGTPGSGLPTGLPGGAGGFNPGGLGNFRPGLPGGSPLPRPGGAR